MSAIEFVQKHGVDVARDLATRGKTSIGYLSVEHHGLNQAELQEIVNAHELEGKHGGLEKANNLICGAFHGSNFEIPDGHEELSIAIDLVEQCNAKS